MPMAARTRPTKSRKRPSWCSQAGSRKSKPWRNVWKRCDRYAMSRHIYFVLTPGFLLLDFAGPAEAFMYARAEMPRIACVCSAAWLAAQAGLLDGRSCTTHHALVGHLRELAPRATVLEDRIFVDDGNVCTSAGITAGIDLALYLIEQLA